MRERSLVDNWRDELVRENGFEMFPAAQSALEEFGGLHVTDRGPGVDRARESFKVDPTLAIDAEDLFEEHSRLLQKRLFPLGEAGDQAFLAIADTGEVFLIFEGVQLVGDNIEEAMTNLIEGRSVPGAKWLYP